MITKNLTYINCISNMSSKPDEVKTWIRPVNLIYSKDPIINSEFYKLAGTWMNFKEIDLVIKKKKLNMNLKYVGLLLEIILTTLQTKF